jgi:hypothetical protein
MNPTTPALSALVWWLIPLIAVFGSIVYVVWVSKFQSKFDKDTHRSMNKFARFQNSFKEKK